MVIETGVGMVIGMVVGMVVEKVVGNCRIKDISM